MCADGTRSWKGFQLVDHRKSGFIGGFYGNGTGGCHAVPYVLDVEPDDTGRPVKLVEAIRPRSAAASPP
jgi:hypothetical protein